MPLYFDNDIDSRQMRVTEFKGSLRNAHDLRVRNIEGVWFLCARYWWLIDTNTGLTFCPVMSRKSIFEVRIRGGSRKNVKGAGQPRANMIVIE